jgi:ribosomal protein S27AE
MSNQVHFNQACPVCGRTLLILVRLLGRRVYCQHCGGGFMAMDESMRRHAAAAKVRVHPETVEELLERASRSLQRVS